MSIEDERKSPAENFVGNLPFGFTTEFIKTRLSEVKQELEIINAELATEDISNIQRERWEGKKALFQTALEVQPDEIFRLFNNIYNLIHDLEAKGTPTADILREIKNRPDLDQAIHNLYGILKAQEWGYRLGQKLFNFRG